MPNLVDSVRQKLLSGRFLTEDELTQAQYELVIDRKTSPKVLFVLADSLFGSNFSRIPFHSIESGPYFSANEEPDIIYDDSDVEDGPATVPVVHPEPLLVRIVC